MRVQGARIAEAEVGASGTPGQPSSAGSSGGLWTPLGPLAIRANARGITGVELFVEAGDSTAVPNELIAAAQQQLGAYFEDPLRGFSLPLELGGTPFQREVWELLAKIPPGQTLTYGDAARQLGTSPRAVGGACRANPCPVLVPCHRIVAVRGLGGYSGARGGRWLEAKSWLLRHEGAHPG